MTPKEKELKIQQLHHKRAVADQQAKFRDNLELADQFNATVLADQTTMTLFVHVPGSGPSGYVNFTGQNYKALREFLRVQYPQH